MARQRSLVAPPGVRLKGAEQVLTTVDLPLAYRIKLEQPLFKALVITDQRLIFSSQNGKHVSYWYKKLKSINYGRVNGGYSRIALRQRWQTYYVDGFLGAVEKEIVFALCLARAKLSHPLL